MKILVLTPCDEKWVHWCAAIYKNLTGDARDKTFFMPLFMDNLIVTKTVYNWVFAYFYAAVAAKSLIKTAMANNDDIIIFGNVNKNDFKFDAVFNFQDAEFDAEYEDLFVEKIKEIVKTDENLLPYVENLYTKEDSKMTLHNCRATAQFVSEYLTTDPHLEDIKAQYDKVLHFKEKGLDDGIGNSF